MAGARAAKVAHPRRVARPARERDPAPVSARLLVLAIDAANPDLVERWAAAGTLHHLQRLLAEGLSGRCRSVEGFFVGSTWPSLYTAVSPARHGHHSLVQLRPGTYELFRPEDEALVHAPPFWDHLARSGLRSAILDVADRGPTKVIQAEAALQRMFDYATELRSLTQGRTVFTMSFARYDAMG
jgi:hypothetical protein